MEIHSESKPETIIKMKFKNKNYSRREFIKTNLIVGTGAVMGAGTTGRVLASCTAINKTTPAVLGGSPP